MISIFKNEAILLLYLIFFFKPILMKLSFQMKFQSDRPNWERWPPLDVIFHWIKTLYVMIKLKGKEK